MRKEAGLKVEPTPAQTLAVHGEVLGNPEYRVRQASKLCGAEFPVEPAR